MGQSWSRGGDNQQCKDYSRAPEAEAILTSTRNLCFRFKIRQYVYPCKPQFYHIKVGLYTFHGHVFLVPSLSKSYMWFHGLCLYLDAYIMNGSYKDMLSSHMLLKMQLSTFHQS